MRSFSFFSARDCCARDFAARHACAASQKKSELFNPPSSHTVLIYAAKCFGKAITNRLCIERVGANFVSLPLPIHSAVLHCLCDMLRKENVAVSQIGNGARDLEHAMIGTGR